MGQEIIFGQESGADNCQSCQNGPEPPSIPLVRWSPAGAPRRLQSITRGWLEFETGLTHESG
jgi:hypothetical protein